MQIAFGALWVFAEEIRSGEMSVEQASKLCMKKAAAEAKEQRKQGRKASRCTLRGQLRQYWGFGEPCGLTCTVYMVNVFS